MSSYPEDQPAGVNPTQPLSASEQRYRQDGVLTDPREGHIDVRDRDGARPYVETGARDRDDSSPVDDAVSTMQSTENRTKLLMAIAAMTALTMLMTLALLLMHFSDAGPEPVLVEGVPCLVEDGPEDQAVLYCQR